MRRPVNFSNAICSLMSPLFQRHPDKLRASLKQQSAKNVNKSLEVIVDVRLTFWNELMLTVPKTL